MTEDVYKQNRQLRRQLRQFMEQARENETKMRRFQSVELHLISVNTLFELIQTVLYDYRSAFGLDALTLVLLDPQYEIQRILEDETIDLTLHPDLIFSTKADQPAALQHPSMFPTLGSYKVRQHASLFPHTRPAPASAAILPLVRHGKLIGSLNLGSARPERFVNGAATDFLERIAAIAAICFENTLNHERLKRMGLTDPLTGVNNRRFFDQRLREEVNRAQRNGEPLSCLFVDLDRFKGINDRYGHQAGDRILNEVAKLLSLQMRTSDVLARYGGEEFSILLSATPSSKAVEIAERIRGGVAAQRFKPLDDAEIEVTLSIGVATLHPLSGQTPLKAYGEELVGLADAALFEAKETGRNRVVCGGEIHAKPKPGRQEVLV